MEKWFENLNHGQDHSRFSETHYLGTLSSVGISGPNAGALSATAVSVVQSLAVS